MYKVFNLEKKGTNIRTEVLAGITTFITMAYILGVNPIILSAGGMPKTGIFFATALASGLGCIVMGLVSDYPIGIAPGMGLNAIFTYTIILSMGNSWNAALAAVFISSVIFLLITVSGLRKLILNITPNDLKLGIGAGLGFFLAFIGLKSCEIIVADPSTYVAMGELLFPPALLGLIGIFTTLVLYIKKVPSAVFIGLVITSILGLVFTVVGFGVGNPLMPTFPKEIFSVNVDTSMFMGFASGFNELFSRHTNLIMMIFSLLIVQFFDATGTLIPLNRLCNFTNENGEDVGIEKPFLGDAIGGVIGAICGTSTLTAYSESATGIELGGRTGLTAVVTGLLFLISIFFAPLFLSLFTSPVTASALVIVGIIMIIPLKDIDWDNIVTISSVFITILTMILTYSISLGIAWGFITYTVGVIASGEKEKLNWGMIAIVIVFLIYIFFGI